MQACNPMQVDRSTVRYQSKRLDDSQLRAEIKLVAKKRRRFGCRRIQVMLERKGVFMNDALTDGRRFRILTVIDDDLRPKYPPVDGESLSLD